MHHAEQNDGFYLIALDAQKQSRDKKRSRNPKEQVDNEETDQRALIYQGQDIPILQNIDHVEHSHHQLKYHDVQVFHCDRQFRHRCLKLRNCLFKLNRPKMPKTLISHSISLSLSNFYDLIHNKRKIKFFYLWAPG